MKKPEYIFIHHTAVSYYKNPDQANATNNFHKKWKLKSSLGFYAGYNYEIAMNGKITQFRKDGEITAAQYQKNMNDGRAISICLDGNFDIEDPTNAQYQACQELILKLVEKYGIRPENILPHRSLASYKSCPGRNLPSDLARHFQIIPIKKENPISKEPEKPTGTPEKRATVIARLLQRSRLIQNIINKTAKEI